MWGGGINLGSLSLAPLVSVGVGIHDQLNYSKNTTTLPDGSSTTLETKDKRNGATAIITKLGTDVSFNITENLSSTAGLYYTLNAKIFPKEKRKTTNTKPETTTTITQSGKQDLTNEIGAFYKIAYKPIENLTIAGRTDLGIGIRSEKTGSTTTTTNGNASPVNNNGRDTLTTGISSSFGIGLQYNIKPNFALNIGYGGYLPTFTSIKTTTYTGDTSSVKTETNPYPSEYSNGLAAGFTWNISEQALLDVGVSTVQNPFDKHSLQSPSLDTFWKATWDLGLSIKL